MCYDSSDETEVLCHLSFYARSTLELLFHCAFVHQQHSIEDFLILLSDHLQYNLDHEVNDLDPADEREACEEPHGASYSRQLVHKLGCSVLFDNIKGRGGH